jgi:hypothetical protein
VVKKAAGMEKKKTGGSKSWLPTLSIYAQPGLLRVVELATMCFTTFFFARKKARERYL